MSEGKAGWYEVVSEEEMRRRAQLAAQQHRARLIDAFELLAADCMAANSIYGPLGVPVEVPPPSEGDPDRLAADNSQLEALLESTRQELEERIGAQRMNRMREILHDVVATTEDSDKLPPLEAATLPLEPRRDVQRALELLARIPGDAGDLEIAKLEGLAMSLRDEANSQRRTTILAAIRDRVQILNRASAQRQENARIATDLLRELDGVEGQEPTRMRQLLHQLPLDEALPPGLVARVQQLVSNARREADRRFVLSGTRAALESLGYTITDDFDTVLPEAPGLLLDLRAHPQYAMRLRERRGSLLFNLVRRSDTADNAVDHQAAVQMCTDHDSLLALLREQGVLITETHRFDAGSGHIEQLAHETRGGQTGVDEADEADDAREARRK